MCVDSEAVMYLGDAISAMTADVAIEFILGRNFKNLDRADFNKDMTIAIQGSGDIWRFNKHVRFGLRLMKALPPWWFAKSGDPGMVAYFEFMKTSHAQTKQIADEIDSDADSSSRLHTVIHDILSSDLPASDKSLSRVQDEVQTLMAAGFETTAQALRFIIFHTFTNPDILRRLRAELQDQMGSGDSEDSKNPSISQLEGLPYLTSVLMEDLRLSPGVGSRLARIAPDRDLVYDGKWVIPTGTPVGMTVVLMHLDENIFSNPTKFDPERWMSPEDRLRQEKYFWPFSSGTRDCLGRQLAWSEMYIALAKIVTRFDFKFVETTAEEVDSKVDRFVIGTQSTKGVKARAYRI